MPAFHIPGYNYCGPGTWDFSKKPTNALDRACRQHDLSYQKKYKNKAGISVHPYFNYTQSDDTLRNAAAKINSPAAKFVGGIFKVKKFISPRAYLSPKERAPITYKKWRQKKRKYRLLKHY